MQHVLKIQSIFRSPETGTAITLAEGDAVYPLALTEICRIDLEISAEMGTIDVTDSCDFPYAVTMPDGVVQLSGSINTMLRFDESTRLMEDVSKELYNKFFDVVRDEGDGTYSFEGQNTDELIFLIDLNKTTVAGDGVYKTYLICPAVLTSLTGNIAMTDVMKADYAWSKGNGPASLYSRKVAQ